MPHVTDSQVDGAKSRSASRGYHGRIVSATETHARIELEARYKTITLPLSHLDPAVVGNVAGEAPRPKDGFAAQARTRVL